ncbi:uncharacterized protein LOC115452928 isoform X2 [Manduca sexta]|uniref:uncharacterized protein LOC115452928 isoform X2 n=1 Tax=Manduca sexta TaxID=7130 RepID=UPI00188F5203|nr:uncharacterized protein LOC115452928 isoform X2 [Manduca sexta]
MKQQYGATKKSWADKSNHQPRSRRVTPLDDDDTNITRSLNIDLIPSKTNVCRRKIVTIAEDDENDLHPKFSKDLRKPGTIKTNRSIAADLKEEKHCSVRSTSRLSTTKYSKDIKTSAKNSGLSKKEINVSKFSQKGPPSNVNKVSEQAKITNIKDKDTSRSVRYSNPSSKVNVSKHLVQSEKSKERPVSKSKVLENFRSNMRHKSNIEITEMTGLTSPSHKSKKTILKEIKNKSKPVTIIHVPLEDKYHKTNKDNVQQMSRNSLVHEKIDNDTIDRGTAMDDIMSYKNVKVGTEPQPAKIDQITDMDTFDYGVSCKCSQSAKVQTDITGTFDSLEIPNVSLTKDKTDNRRKTDSLYTKSMPNLQSPEGKSNRKEKSSSDINFCKSTSYIISHSTLTYTTEQKINFHVVEGEEETRHKSPSPLSYPVNVLSVYKNEIKKKSNIDKIINIERESNDQNKTSDVNNVRRLDDTYSPNCSYAFDGNKLMKPSDIISTISVNNGLMQSEYICEQFQQELNFIDSFFESLQYLESCSLSNKCFANSKVENLIRNPVLLESEYDIKDSAEYSTLLSKFDNSANVDNAETMASKNLCLLNLLIHDEQRRAQSLLLVLKMRENALKHFTKSQVLWLENRKKLDNTDISNLRKKQRGALVKLQHERGEMQRMRKALIALSEKRKTALMKTKKSIELKLKDNVDVEQILLGKKKLKRSPTGERHVGAPLKCFELSSSGCEDSTTPRPHSEPMPRAAHACALHATLPTPPNPSAPSEPPATRSAEKCIQTNDCSSATAIGGRLPDAAAENFVVVDGGYLNILFQNLSLPQIFSGGKHYEVNEEALKNIVNSANTHHSQLNKTDVVEKLMEQIKNRSLDKSSAPSTARSLVDEYDYYYKELSEEEKSIVSPKVRHASTTIDSDYEIKEPVVQASECSVDQLENSQQSASTMTSDSSDEVVSLSVPVEVHEAPQEGSPEELDGGSGESGPLPVPAGAAATPDPFTTDVSTWPHLKTTTSDTESSVSSPSLCPSVSSITSPVNYEAEELRRQQLAIEREIKALEQQQCRLLVVREIPDKPPPPYTPPADSRVPRPPRMFLAGDSTDEKIQRHIIDPAADIFDTTDAFDMFVKDFCQESLERQRLDQSDRPWDACNLLPEKPIVTMEKLAKTTSAELVEVLTGVTPTVVSGVGARRSDHIDDILFAEWRRCEPEWTSLHTDEAIVKSQIFECIFQKILSETVDEYKKIVLPCAETKPA